jgi:hypothetical protein
MFVSREHGALPAMENGPPREYSNSWANQGPGILKQALLEKRNIRSEVRSASGSATYAGVSSGCGAL